MDIEKPECVRKHGPMRFDGFAPNDKSSPDYRSCAVFECSKCGYIEIKRLNKED